MLEKDNENICKNGKRKLKKRVENSVLGGGCEQKHVFAEMYFLKNSNWLQLSVFGKWSFVPIQSHQTLQKWGVSADLLVAKVPFWERGLEIGFTICDT